MIELYILMGVLCVNFVLFSFLAYFTAKSYRYRRLTIVSFLLVLTFAVGLLGTMSHIQRIEDAEHQAFMKS